MRTISSLVRDKLKRRPTILRHLQDGLINATALARKIRPEIEGASGEKVSLEAITAAIIRYTKEIQTKPQLADPSLFVGDISIQTGLSNINFTAADFDNETRSAAEALKSRGEFYIMTQGVWYGGLIARGDALEGIGLNKPKVTRRVDNLVGVTVKLRPGHEPVLGVCANIVSLVADNGVNLDEVISTEHEMTLIVSEEDADTATRVLVAASKMS